VHDAVGHSYTFGTFHLSAGQTVYLHTGTGADIWQHRYWSHGWYVWNNNGDTAHLHNALGTLRDACTWPGGAPPATSTADRSHPLIGTLTAQPDGPDRAIGRKPSHVRAPRRIRPRVRQ
jgi:hypothetical protein